MTIIPSIDISNGKAVKRIRGRRGTEVTIGDPIKVAERLYNAGYSHVHIVDLDAAEGLGSNEEMIKTILSIGFKWAQVGGGIRTLAKASRIISYGASSIILSTTYFKDRAKFDEIVRGIGSDKVIVSLDYRSDGYVYLSGWREKGPKLEQTLEEIRYYNLLGVLFTYIDSEGTMGGIDRGVAKYINKVRGLKEYAGGVSTIDDVRYLTYIGFDHVIVGMAFYRGVIG